MRLSSKAIICAIVFIFGLSAPVWSQSLKVSQSKMNPLLEAKVELWKGDKLFDNGDAQGAIQSYLEASTYVRDAPEPHFALAQVYVRKSIMDAFLEFAIGLKLLFGDFFHQAILVSNVLVLGILAVSLAIYVAVAVIVLRHLPLLWTSIQISLPVWIQDRHRHIVIGAAIVGFFLVASSRSPIAILTWSCAIGAAMIWRFASSGERRVILGFAVYLLLIGSLLSLTGRVLSTQLPNSTVRLASLADKMDETWLERAYAADSSPKRFDPVGQFIIGLLNLRSGQYDQAIDHFNLVTKFTPSNAAVLNNMGVAYYELGNLKRARHMFEEALKHGQREAIIHYNYSQVLNALLEYDLAEEELAKASALDFGITRDLLTAQRSGPIAMNLQTRVLWQLALSPENDYLKIAYHPTEVGLFGRIILLIVSLVFIFGSYRLSIPACCDICDTPIPALGTRRRGKQLLCSRCARIASSNREHRELEHQYKLRIANLERRHKLLTIGLGLLLPGVPFHLVGKRLKGFLITSAFSTLVLMVVANGPIIKPLPSLRPTNLNHYLVPVLAVSYAIYGWRMLVVTIRKSREEE